jgi:signal transduction histidine kinase
MTADAQAGHALADRRAWRKPIPGSAGLDLSLVYQAFRLRLAPVGLLLTLAVATSTGWPNGPWVPLAALAITLHAFYVERFGAPNALTLLIDGAAVALVTLTMSIPVVTAATFSFFAVVASILTTGKRSIRVATFTAGWVAMSLAFSYAGFKDAYDPRAKVIIELAAVFFFAIAISVLVAVVMRRLRQAETQRVDAVAELEQANARLEELLEAKDRFVASVSHELRTPLTAVVGLSQELSHPDASFASDEVEEMQQLIAGEAKEVAAIVEDLLVAARTDIGEIAIFAKVVDVFALVHETAEAVAADPGAIHVVGEGYAWADPLRVKQILRNLLSNWLRYGGELVDVRIMSDSDHTRVEVRDNGPGVDPSRVDSIFDPYETASSGQRHVKSVGLGLSVSKTLATLMGGDLEYRREGCWTVFEVSLPAARADRAD